ncbi:MAG: hypothetical protein ISN29_09690 [Gammaproteobacteria bacterium AqS3]|nr:hypothetical protein [Gammaproteobacteria bacterium AqS3]
MRTDDALHTFQVVADMAFATKREAQAYAVKREPCYRCRRVEYVPGRLGRFTDHTLRAMALEAYLNMKHHKNGEEP